MMVLQRVLTSAGLGLVAVLMGLIWRMFVHFDAKNEQAHATIDDRAERRAEAHRAALESIARDVSFLAGRQAERDRQAERASGLSVRMGGIVSATVQDASAGDLAMLPEAVGAA